MKKILYFFIVIVLIFFLLINILSITNNSFFGFRVFRVGSGSMEPTLKVNSLILVKSNNNYNVSDIVTYEENSDYITHRIISINDDEIITKGDANNIEDKPITKDMIIGKLIYAFKINNFISYLLSRPMTWILLLFLGATFIFIIPVKNE